MIQLYRNVIQLHRAGTELPRVLAEVYHGHTADVTPANAATQCGRCGRTWFDHLWLVVAPADSEQDGVIDCAGVNK